MVRLGLGSFIALGIHTPYTTDGASAQTLLYLRVEGGEVSPQYERDRVVPENLDSYDPVQALIKGGQKRITGTVTFKLTWGDAQDVLRIITAHNVTVSGVGPFTYAFIPEDPAAASHHFSGTTVRHVVMEVFAQDTGSLSTFYQGLIVTSAQLQFEPNGIVMCTLTFIGRDQTRTAKSATPVYKTDMMYTPTGQAALLFKLDGTDRRANSVTITIDTPMAHRYDVIDDSPSVHPLPEGKRVVRVEADIEAPDTDAALVSAIEDPVANVFGGVNTVVITDGTHTMTWTFFDLQLDPPAEARPESIGVIRAALSLTAGNDGTNAAAYKVDLIGPTSNYIIT